MRSIGKRFQLEKSRSIIGFSSIFPRKRFVDNRYGSLKTVYVCERVCCTKCFDRRTSRTWRRKLWLSIVVKSLLLKNKGTAKPLRWRSKVEAEAVEESGSGSGGEDLPFANGKWVMEWGIRLMNWKWMLFSKALKSIFLPNFHISTIANRIPHQAQPANQIQNRNSLNRFTL